MNYKRYVVFLCLAVVLISAVGMFYRGLNCSANVLEDENISIVNSLFVTLMESLMDNEVDKAMNLLLPFEEDMRFNYYAQRQAWEVEVITDYLIESIEKISPVLYQVTFLVERVGWTEPFERFRVWSFAGYINDSWYIILNEYWLPDDLKAHFYNH